MKIIAALSLLSFSITSNAQNLPVLQSTTNKKAVIEEFTAYRCGNCPGGHQAAREAGETLGEENVIVIGYHFGGLANPIGNDPDLRTSEGNALGSFYGVTGTPVGPVNRADFGSAATWLGNATNRISETAEVNVALDVTINIGNREATVSTESFYTSNSASTHFLTIGYVQNDIVGPQSTYNASWNSDFFNPDGTYRHQHVFRGYINGNSGTALDANAAGVISNNYTFTIPTDLNDVAIDLENLQFFALIHLGENTPTDSDILNAALTSPTLNGVGVDEINPLDELVVYPNPSKGKINIENLSDEATIQIKDLLGKRIDHSRTNDSIQINMQGVFFIQISEQDFSRTIKVIID